MAKNKNKKEDQGIAILVTMLSLETVLWTNGHVLDFSVMGDPRKPGNDTEYAHCERG